MSTDTNDRAALADDALFDAAASLLDTAARHLFAKAAPFLPDGATYGHANGSTGVITSTTTYFSIAGRVEWGTVKAHRDRGETRFAVTIFFVGTRNEHGEGSTIEDAAREPVAAFRDLLDNEADAAGGEA